MAGLTRSSFGLRPTPSTVVPTLALTAAGKSIVRIEANSSASQHKTFDTCKRKWWFDKVAGVREKEKQHFVFGHALHGVAERYILGQTKSWEELFPKAWDVGLSEYESNQIRTMATKAVEKGVWQAVPDSMIEFALAFLVGPEFVDARGLPLLAKADTYKDDNGVRRIAQLTSLYDDKPLPSGWNALPPYVGFIDHMILWDTPPTIADHKTSKNRNYATTPAKLAEDLQVLSYAAVPMAIRPDVDLVKLRHNLFLKNEGAADPYVVPAVAPYAKVRATWDHIRTNAVDMGLIREVAPKVVDAGNPFARANNWQRVKSAIEEGRAKEACNMYGGCPFKDICFGRATAEQVLRRIDAPSQMPLVKSAAAPEPKFGLRGRPTPAASQPYNAPSRFAPKATTEPPIEWPKLPDGKPDLSPLFPNTQAKSRFQEIPMVFAPKPLSVNQDVYVLDPEDPTLQYRAHIVKAEGANVDLALYPNADVTPVFESLSHQYRITVPKELVLPIPSMTAKVKSYQEALTAVGIVEGLEWTAAAAASTPTLPATTKPASKPPRDGAFGLKGAPPVVPPAPPATAPATPPVAETLPPGTPAWAMQGVADGTLVKVKPTTHSFWSKHSGKVATVTGSAPGEVEGSTHLHLVIDGLPYNDANAHRFEPMVVDVSAPATPIEQMPIQQRAAMLKGTSVTIRLFSTESPFNAVLEDVNADGIVFLSGQMKPSWADVKSLEAFSPLNIPGRAPTKEEKKEARQAAKAAKAAEGAAPGTEGAPAAAPQAFGVEPANALQSAIEAVQAVLNGGKVTRKAMEGIVPLLAAAKVHQTNLESGAPAAPQAAGDRLYPLLMKCRDAILAAGGHIPVGAVTVVDGKNVDVKQLNAEAIYATDSDKVAALLGGAPPTPVAPAAAPQVFGVLRVAIDHAISTLTDAKGKLP